MMKILWLCNIVLPDIAKELNLKASNKEGWLSGICDTVKKSHDFELAVCFPVSKKLDGMKREKDGIRYYGFYEDTVHPEKYDDSLEDRLIKIVKDFTPDKVHIFGTEYPHTLAMCRVLRDEPSKLFVGIQGVMDVYKDHYFDGLPEYVINRATFRDLLKQDSLKQQQQKYLLRAVNEVEAVKIAGNVLGRTPFDKAFSRRVNPTAYYHILNETLRINFYGDSWDIDSCEPHSIFLSQGNYPIKGLHYMLAALPGIVKKYPDVKVYVAGDAITSRRTLKDRIKIGSYGKYLVELIKKNNINEHVVFLGNLDADGVKERLLKSQLFICPSTIENSPNSLGEAMILGVPCIATDVGGIGGIFDKEKDGFIVEFGDVKGLSEAVIGLWEDINLQRKISGSARIHATRTHDAMANYKRLIEIYSL